MQSNPEREFKDDWWDRMWPWRRFAELLAAAMIVMLFFLVYTVNQRAAEDVSDVERLLAIEEIGRLKASYFRCLDTNDWACIETLFAPDGTAVYNVEGSGDLGTPDNPVTGPANIAAFIQNGVEHLTTVHHGHMPEIEITSPTTATGIWAMMDILQIPDGENTLVGWGHYHETYERIDGRWRIKTLRLTRLRVDRAE